MIFKCFSKDSDYVGTLNADVGSFINDKENEGYEIVDKTVHVENGGDNSLIKPQIVITIWMEKEGKA